MKWIFVFGFFYTIYITPPNIMKDDPHVFISIKTYNLGGKKKQETFLAKGEKGGRQRQTGKSFLKDVK